MNTPMNRRTLIAAGVATAGALLLKNEAQAEKGVVRKVVVWSEGTAPKKIYPDDVNTVIAEGLKSLKGWEVSTASLNDPDQGLSVETLNKTDVLIWWGHQRHGDVKDELVQRIAHRVKEEGMGFIATHSAHYAKALQTILGTNCGWKGGYIEDGSKLDLIVKSPKHPIAKGVKDFVVPHTERYGDPFECPTPEAFVFDGLYTLPDGTKQHAQQGLTWTVGKGRVFYFQPGHESYPIYFQPEIQKIFRNGVVWASGKK